MDLQGLSLSGLKDKITALTGSKNSKTASKAKPSAPKDRAPEQKTEASTAPVKDSGKKKNALEHKSNGNAKSNKAKPNKLKAAQTAQVPESNELSNSDNEEEDEREVLKREALALGATEEDIKMLQDLEDEGSEAEFDDAEADPALDADLKSFMNGLGLEAVAESTTDSLKTQEELKAEAKAQAKAEAKAAKKEERAAEKAARKAQKEKQQKEKEEQQRLEKERLEKEKKEKELKEKANSEKKDRSINSVDSAKLQIEARVDWYSLLPEVEEPEKLDRFGVERLLERGEKLLEAENKRYLAEFSANNSQKKFLAQILADGTLNDKISALTLLVQEAPLHNMKALDTLVGYCEKKLRNAAMQALTATKDLMLNGLLPDRKLLAFAKQNLRKDLSDETLAIYCFEDHLKKAYFRIIQTLEHLGLDPILHVRMNVVGHVFDLLKSKPEQEANLLRLGVNKLGDKEKKIAAKTLHMILQLEETHPAMKKIVSDAVTDLAVQRGSKENYHTQYYSVVTLNQTVLLAGDVDLANSLVKTYFSLFEKVLIDTDPLQKEGKSDKTLGLSERGRKNLRRQLKKGKHGGVLVAQKTEEELAEERAGKMFLSLLTGINRAFPYADLPSEIYTLHMDTLFKITHLTNFATAVQALVLVQHVIQEQSLDPDRFYRTLYESLLDPRLVQLSKQGVYLNLLFKSIKQDTNKQRVIAFAKRILQVCLHWVSVGPVAGMFFLLMLLTKEHPQLLDLLDSPDEETLAASSEAGDKSVKKEEYDPRCRNPAFAHADKTRLWEITHFANHYHPTVSLYASLFCDATPQPKPDLGLYTLAHFLDRFVYKNPKAKAALRGLSIMQPLGGGELGSRLNSATNVAGAVPVNTVDWLLKRAADIRPDERFFHQYFTHNQTRIRQQAKEDAAEDAEDAEEDEDAEGLDDDKVWDALVKSQPDIDGASDDDMSDFDAADFEDLSDGDSDGAEGAELDVDVDEDLVDDDEDGDVFPEFGDSEAEASSDDGDDPAAGESDEEASKEPAAKNKRRGEAGESDLKAKRRRRAELRALPTFASADDYSQYLQSDEDDF